MNTLIEDKAGHGALPINRFHRKLHKLLKRKTIGNLAPFDWATGYDVRTKIGSLPIKNQGGNFSCSGQAGGYFLEVQRRLQGCAEAEISAKSIYAPIAYSGGGTTVARLVQQLAVYGANLESQVSSYDANGQPLPEPLMAELSWRTQVSIAGAENRAGYTPYDIGETIDEVASTIQNYGAVIFEVCGQNNGTWTTPTPMPPSKNNFNPYWYHFMCGVGAKMINGKKTIICYQSEGQNWGDGGMQYLNEDFFNGGGIIDAFTLIYDKNVTPLPTNHSLWADILRWFRAKWGLTTGFVA